MPELFDPRIEILPAAQKEIWPQLAPAPDLSFVLYGGTAVALHLGHRVSIDFDFFKAEPLEKARIEASFQFFRHARTLTSTIKLWGRRMNLVGAWVVDETDALTLERWGNVVLEFDESGGLSYTIRGDDKDEIIILRYQVEGSALITDQPSAPKVERTQFSFTPDGVLVLAFGGVPSRFVRTPTPPTRLKSSAVH
jgi:hypothetical protein